MLCKNCIIDELLTRKELDIVWFYPEPAGLDSTYYELKKIQYNIAKKVTKQKKWGELYERLIPALKRAGDDQTSWTPAINLTIGWIQALRELKEEGLENLDLDKLGDLFKSLNNL